MGILLCRVSPTDRYPADMSEGTGSGDRVRAASLWWLALLLPIVITIVLTWLGILDWRFTDDGLLRADGRDGDAAVEESPSAIPTAPATVEPPDAKSSPPALTVTSSPTSLAKPSQEAWTPQPDYWPLGDVPSFDEIRACILEDLSDDSMYENTLESLHLSESDFGAPIVLQATIGPTDHGYELWVRDRDCIGQQVTRLEPGTTVTLEGAWIGSYLIFTRSADGRMTCRSCCSAPTPTTGRPTTTEQDSIGTGSRGGDGGQGTLDPEAVRSTGDHATTKAVIATHTHGVPADVPRITEP